MLSELLASVVACPVDKQELVDHSDHGWLYNPRLGVKYPVAATGVVQLLVESGQPVTEADIARWESDGV